MLNEIQEAEVWKRVLGEDQPAEKKPEPIPRPYPTEPVKPEPIPRPYPTEPVKPEPIPRPYPTEPVRPAPIPRPYPTEPVRPAPIPRPQPVEPEVDLSPSCIMKLLQDAMEAGRTYKALIPMGDAKQKPILRQLATVQEQQCHRLLTLLQVSV